MALAIAVAMYGAMLAMGGVLYATGAIGQGATHNNCSGYRAQIASQLGIAQQGVPQEQIKSATQACLDTRRLSKWEAVKSEYLIWAAWPALVSAAIFFVWPLWAATLHRQELDAEARATALDART
jgi:hypothetical protein